MTATVATITATVAPAGSIISGGIADEAAAFILDESGADILDEQGVVIFAASIAATVT